MKKTDAKTDKLSNTIALYTAIALLVAGAVGYLLVKPLYSDAQATGVKTAKVKTETAALVQLGKDTDTLRTNYASVKDSRDQILHQLPLTSEEERLIALLGAMGQANGVVVNSFAPSDTSAATAAAAASSSDLSVYPASITVTGTYAQIQALLKNIETSARFIGVQASTLSGSPASTSVSGQILFQAYYQTGGK